MKSLLLLRHAKALRQPADDDLERALAPEGIEACARMGRFLKAAGFVPTALLTSPARRARETLAEVAAAADWHQPHEVRPLYEAKPADVIAELRLVPDSGDLAVAVGHEPTWSKTASKLIGGGEIHLSTGSAACIGFDLESWRDLAKGRGRLLWLVPPQILAAP
jgi:phosphohistidine phosphatase